MGTSVCLGAHLGVLEKPIPLLGLHSYGPSGEENPACSWGVALCVRQIRWGQECPTGRVSVILRATYFCFWGCL